ncbi:MAG: M1 family metallopeptidase [Marmoricola sp.]
MVRSFVALTAACTLLLAGCGGSPGSGAQAAPGTRSAEPTTPRTTQPTTQPTAPPRVRSRWGAAASSPLEDSVYPGVGDPTVDALHYGLDLHWNRTSKRLTATASIRFRVARAAPKGFPLDFDRRLRTSHVTLDGADISRHTTHRGEQLLVGAPVTGGLHTLRVSYAGVPGPVEAPTGRADIPGVGWTTLRNGQVRVMQEPYGAFTWYPVNDQPSDKAFYDITVHAPGTWVGVSNGKLVSRHSTGGSTVTSWHLERPASSYLVTVAIGPYHRYRDTGPDQVPITYWVRDADKKVLRVLRKAPAAVGYLEKRLGKAPFRRMGFLLVPQASGMETQDMITLGIDNMRADNGETVVHELAHQWYGDAVTPRDWRDVWMSEGMAMYVEAEWTVDQHIDRWSDWTSQWRSSDQQLRDAYGPPGAYHKDQFAQGNVYYPPALMWRTLRARLGAPMFERLRRGWVQQHLYTNQDRDELADWWSARSGQDLRAFFTTWLMSETTPRQ